MPNVITIHTLDDPRLHDYRDVKERQLAAHFGAAGTTGSPDAPFGKLYAEGPLVLDHLLQSRHTPLSILTTPTRLEALERELTAALPRDLPIYLLPQTQLDRVIGFNMHRGLLAVAARARVPTLNEFVCALASPPKGQGHLLVLEDLSNHDNVGAIFRHAAAFGAAGVILSPRCADPLYRKSVRVSMGHALRVPWCWATPSPASDQLHPPHRSNGAPHVSGGSSQPDLMPSVLADLEQAGWPTLAMTPTAEHDIISFTSNHRMNVNFAIMIGAEGPGLTTPSIARATHRLRITMAPGVDSLNAATTAALALYELTRSARR